MNNNFVDEVINQPPEDVKRKYEESAKITNRQVFTEQSCFFCRLVGNDIHELYQNKHEEDIKIKTFPKNKADGVFKIDCPYCGQYTISEEVFQNIWDNFNIRSKLASIAQEKKLIGQDGYFLIWKGSPDVKPQNAIYEKGSNIPFLDCYPLDEGNKNNRILLNVALLGEKCHDSYKFEITPFQFGLFYLSQLDVLYKYHLHWSTDEHYLPSKEALFDQIKNKIKTSLDEFVKNNFIHKDDTVENLTYEITQTGFNKICSLLKYVTKGNFTFHGIGHGLMYTGSISSFPINTSNTLLSLPCPPTLNFIYDCGTLGTKNEINNVIKNDLPSHIDFIVISHLDADHINGLEQIRSKYSSSGKIKVFLPYFDARNYKNVFKMFMLMPTTKEKNGNDNDNDNYIDIVDKYLTNLQNCPVISNNHSRQGSQDDLLFDFYFIDGDVQNPKEISQYIIWNFYFYNRNCSDDKGLDYKEFEKKVEQLNKNIEKQLEKDRDIIKLINTDKKIKKDFYKLFGDRNNYSLLMLHWSPTDPSTKTLLTGDVQFNEDLIKRIKSNLQKPYILQVPHHGAEDSWVSMSEDKTFILWKNADKLVFSVRYPFHEDEHEQLQQKNSSKHPNQICYNDIRDAKYQGQIIIVHQGDGDKIKSESFTYPNKQ